MPRACRDEIHVHMHVRVHVQPDDPESPSQKGAPRVAQSLPVNRMLLGSSRRLDTARRTRRVRLGTLPASAGEPQRALEGSVKRSGGYSALNRQHQNQILCARDHLSVSTIVVQAQLKMREAAARTKSLEPYIDALCFRTIRGGGPAAEDRRRCGSQPRTFLLGNLSIAQFVRR